MRPVFTVKSITFNACRCSARYVQVAVPTPFDSTAHNGLEQYTWDDDKKRIKVKYTFNDGSFSGKETVVYQKGRVNPNSENGARWQVNTCRRTVSRVGSHIDIRLVCMIVASTPAVIGNCGKGVLNAVTDGAFTSCDARRCCDIHVNRSNLGWDSSTCPFGSITPLST